MEHTKMDPIAYALQCLQARVEEESRVEGDSLLLVEEQIRFRIGFDDIENDGHYASHMYVWIEHPSWTDPMYEMCSALGDTVEEAIEGSVSSFIFAAYSCCQKIRKKQWCGGFSTEVQGKKRIWHLCGGTKALMGKEPNVDQDYCLWQVIQEEVKKYLGALKHYWIKMYIGKGKDNNISEVRINDMCIAELSDLLRSYADTLSITESSFYSEKQFFFLEQDESTFEPYPYSKEEIEKKTEETLRLKWNSYQMGYLDRFDEEVGSICGNDPMLYIELICFMREMTAIYAYQEDISFGQEIFAYRDGKVQELYYATQFTAYPWIFNKMMDLFFSGEVPKKLFEVWLAESAIQHLIEQIEEKGATADFIRGFGVIDEDYTLKVR